MDTVFYSDFSENIEAFMHRVNCDSEPLLVTSRNSGDTVVVMSKGEYNLLQK
ncbi:type II toxin-antitoxin system Phd/YefM family antitoxin [Lacticaseibacillus sharpeae]|uniref:type II toxin-antitoxin system Phd/YefM family antitoxin n=1 Tax=Lacticaseibacillus sharpeae TaxID=1626 RepID=UPI0009E9C8F6|nr:type II toxin-antitoxin system Phd/YefM family antitoxin [Lacticaseibacillus sharpeae]